jgi:hypothetical protein
MRPTPDPARTGATPSPSEAGEWGPILLLTAAWVGMAILVDPRGEFSLNDDWAYALPVKAFVERGSIRFTFWQSMTLIAQMLWGALFCLPRGFSYLALRVSMLTAGLAGVLGLYRLCRHTGAGTALATLAALTLALNPLYFGLSCTFMTDVSFTALLILSILGLFLGLDTGRDRLLRIGLVAAFAALFVRQLALAVFLAFLVASPLKLGFGRRWLLYAVFPTLLAGVCLAAYSRVLAYFGRLPGAYYLKANSLNMMIEDLLHFRLGAFKPALRAAIMMSVFAGLFALPLLSALWPSLVSGFEKRRRNLRRGWTVGVTCAVTAILAIIGNLLPRSGNIMQDLRMGIVVLPGSSLAVAPKAYWIVLTAAAALGLSLLLLVLFDLSTAAIRRRDESGATLRFRVVFLLLTCVLYFGPLGLPYQAMLDRYVLPILAVFIVLSVLVRQVDSGQVTRRSLATGLILAAMFGAYTMATVHDLFAWQRVRWEACNDLMAGRVTGVEVPPDQIDGGFEFNNQIPNEQTIYTTSVNGDLVTDAQARPYAVAFSELPGFETLGRRRTPVWLPYPPREIFVLLSTAPRN